MRATYRGLAHAIAVLVVIQAMAIAYAISGLAQWVEDDGGVLDKAAFESEESLFPEEVGFMIHGMSGMMLIPLVALILLIVSFFAKVANATKIAAAILVLVIVQVIMGIAHIPALAALHALNAFIVLGASLAASRLAKAEAPAAATGAAAPEHV